MPLVGFGCFCKGFQIADQLCPVYSSLDKRKLLMVVLISQAACWHPHSAWFPEDWPAPLDSEWWPNQPLISLGSFTTKPHVKLKQLNRKQSSCLSSLSAVIKEGEEAYWKHDSLWWNFWVLSFFLTESFWQSHPKCCPSSPRSFTILRSKNWSLCYEIAGFYGLNVKMKLELFMIALDNFQEPG